MPWRGGEASITYGYGLYRIWLQVSVTYGYGVYHIWLQALLDAEERAKVEGKPLPGEE